MQASQKVLVSCKNIGKTFGQHEVLKNCSFSIHEGEKIGLVGPNGSGKSTLFKIIMGELSLDEGVIEMPKQTKIGYFSQSPQIEGLSGGEAAKKILEPIIKSGSNLFLLDEPTNNLDIPGLEMVEKFVMESTSSFIIASHDREFLDKTVTKIIELDEVTKSLVVYDGNYSEYAEERINKMERQWKDYADKVEKTEKYQTSVVEKTDWKKVIEQKRKNIKNLPIHEKEKPVAAILRDQEGRMGRRARIMRDRLERFRDETTEVTRPPRLLPLKIELDDFERSGSKVFELENIVKKYGSKDIGPLTLSIQYGDRVHIQGKNGAGKSTLLKMLIQKIKSDEGALEVGSNVRIGYLAQDVWSRVSEKTVLEEFMSITKKEEEDARKILNRFRITAVDVHKKVSDLSPGEYSRLSIATMLAEKPNCLILDEPTNNLDLEVLEELEKGLKTFSGTLIVVSHDRYFLNRIDLTRSISLDK